MGMLTESDLASISAAVAVVVRDAVAPVVERLETLEASHTALGVAMEAGFISVRQDMQAHFRHLNDRLTRIESRIATVELKLDHAITGRRADSTRLDALEARLDALEAIVNALPGQ